MHTMRRERDEDRVMVKAAAQTAYAAAAAASAVARLPPPPPPPPSAAKAPALQPVYEDIVAKHAPLALTINVDAATWHCDVILNRPRIKAPPQFKAPPGELVRKAPPGNLDGRPYQAEFKAAPPSLQAQMARTTAAAAEEPPPVYKAAPPELRAQWGAATTPMGPMDRLVPQHRWKPAHDTAHQ